jgi:phosphoribosylanthranilate isomerase
VVTSVKFCGLTRAEDADKAVALGASFVGAVMAGGPRNVLPAVAREVLANAGPAAQRVGVFGADSPTSIHEAAQLAAVDIIQLHGDPRAADLSAIRARFAGPLWAVIRADGSLLPDWADELFREADAVLLDARVPNRLGGTGVTLQWGALARTLDELRRETRVVLAGGLRPENVAEAIRLLSPDVVDVSSGVESAPGIKDHARMQAFMNAAREQST